MKPAEVLGLIEIPSHVQFWGIDSGIRHRYNYFNNAFLIVQSLVFVYLVWISSIKLCIMPSTMCFFICSMLHVCCSVGGTDYGSVRIGAFMGRKMIKTGASSVLLKSSSENDSQQPGNRLNSDEVEGGANELLEAEASLDYLCNLPPHR